MPLALRSPNGSAAGGVVGLAAATGVAYALPGAADDRRRGWAVSLAPPERRGQVVGWYGLAMWGVGRR